MTTATRSLPPFTRESAIQEVRLAEDGQNIPRPRQDGYRICDRFTMEEPRGVHETRAIRGRAICCI